MDSGTYRSPARAGFSPKNERGITPTTPAGDVQETPGIIPDTAIRGIGKAADRAVAPRRRTRASPDQCPELLRLHNGQELKQHGIQLAEDRRRGANTQRQRSHEHTCRRGNSREGSPRVPQVAAGVVN